MFAYQYPHHQKTVEKFIREHEADGEILAIMLGGSVAKRVARPDSDVDLLICVTEARYRQLEQTAKLTNGIVDHTYYENGFYDIKYCTKDYLVQCAEHGSEPARNAYKMVRVVFARDAEIEGIVAQIPVFQQKEKAEKLLSYYSTLELSHGYYWCCCVSGHDNPYLKTRTAADLVLCGLRLFLQEKETLFPCQRRLMDTVRALPEGNRLADCAEDFLRRMDDESEMAFVSLVKSMLRYQPPENHDVLDTRHVTDVELWWYKNRPNLVEW